VKANKTEREKAEKEETGGGNTGGERPMTGAEDEAEADEAVVKIVGQHEAEVETGDDGLREGGAGGQVVANRPGQQMGEKHVKDSQA